MRRGWEVELRDGTIIQETQMNWKEVPKKDIIRLTLHFEGREWNIHDKPAYLQKKKASMVPGIDETFTVESRSIGYYDDNNKVWYTVNESTGMMKMEVE